LSLLASKKLEDIATRLKHNITALMEQFQIAKQLLLNEEVHKMVKIHKRDLANNPLYKALKKIKPQEANDMHDLAFKWKLDLIRELPLAHHLSLDGLKTKIHEISSELEYLRDAMLHLSDDIKFKFPQTLKTVEKALKLCEFLGCELQGHFDIYVIEKYLQTLAVYVYRCLDLAIALRDYIDAYQTHKLEEKGLKQTIAPMQLTTSIEDVKKFLRDEAKDEFLESAFTTTINLSDVEWRILKTLRKANKYIKSHVLAEMLGVSASLVQKKALNLKTYGLIKSHAKKGYKLTDFGKNFVENAFRG